MRRRRFLTGAVCLAALPRPATAQRIPRVGYLFSFTPASGRHYWDACRQGLADLGYVEGRTVALEPRWAHGRHDALPRLATELVRGRADVIVAAATPATEAASAATSTVPIVMVAVADPVRAGFVTSLARPGGNITGLSLLTPELSGKRVELLAEILAALPRLGVVANPDNASVQVFLEETRAAARTTGTEVHTLEARTVQEIDAAFEAAAAARLSALIVFDDPVLWSHRARIVRLAARRRVPVMYGYREFVEEGGLVSYGPSRPALYRRTAVYVDRILKGARPAELPVERPTVFELVVNTRAAAALGITLAPGLLARADHVMDAPLPAP
jgi:putative ABC transport system substrate-binding protein